MCFGAIAETERSLERFQFRRLGDTGRLCQSQPRVARVVDVMARVANGRLRDFDSHILANTVWTFDTTIAKHSAGFTKASHASPVLL